MVGLSANVISKRTTVVDTSIHTHVRDWFLGIIKELIYIGINATTDHYIVAHLR